MSNSAARYDKEKVAFSGQDPELEGDVFQAEAGHQIQYKTLSWQVC
jgi:hypothetical protein